MEDFECGKCGAMFADEEQLAEHMEQAHQNQGGDFECSECGARFGNRYELATHIRNAHST